MSQINIMTRALFILAFFVTFFSQAATYVVDNTNNTGAGSLRQAINNANTGGADTIVFNFASAPQTINLTSRLPDITDDGTVILGDFDGICGPDIVIDGNGMNGYGLRVFGANDVVISGVVVGGWTGVALFAGYGIILNSCSGCWVYNCYVGVEADGLTANANEQANIIFGDASNCTIGDTTACGRNIVGFSSAAGITVSNAATVGNTFHNNYIGVGADGVTPIGNDGSGIMLVGSTSDNLIGGTCSLCANIISNNTNSGISINNGFSNYAVGNMVGIDASGGCAPNGTSGIWVNNSDNNIQENVIGCNRTGIQITSNGSNNLVLGNYIGTDKTQTLQIPNTDEGIYLNTTDGNTIGTFEEPNIIAFNNGAAINVVQPSVNNTFHYNSTYSNGSAITSSNVTLPLINRIGQDNIITGTAAFNTNQDSIFVFLDSTNQGQLLLGSAPIQTDGSWSYTLSAADSALMLSLGLFNINILSDSANNTSGFGVFMDKPFITTWQTDNPGTSADNQVTITTWAGSGTYNYNVYWEEVGNPANNGTETGLTGDQTITFPTIGTYRLEITGAFPHFRFALSGNDPEKLLSVEQWGDNPWMSTNNMFAGATNLTINAVDSPNLTGVTDMSNMFYNATSMNANIGNWDVSNVLNMSHLFSGASSFNQDIGNWDVSGVTNMSSMFQQATAFNQDISNWNVENVLMMDFMFSLADAFNQDIGSWNVENVNTMQGMFQTARAFNQDIGNWNVGSVLNMSLMFSNARNFNQDISGWVVNQVTDMSSMFRNARSFNQNIGGWNLSSVTNLSFMFEGAIDFNQNLSAWDISDVTDMTSMLDNTGFSMLNYDNTLIGWNSLSVLQNNVNFSASNLNYCTAESARQNLINTYGWIITDAGSACPFITTWQTDIAGESGPTEIILPLPNTPVGFNYDVYWEEVGNPTNNGSATGLTGVYTINVISAGTYLVEITGDFPHFTFQGGTGDHDKLLTVEQWGDIEWNSMNSMFRDASNLTINATDAPDLSSVTDMRSMFFRASSFNSNINHWDVSQVENMSQMFGSASSFDQDLNNWNVSSVTNMSYMFWLASDFNGNISSWTTSSLINTSNMFAGASSFNQDISNWDMDMVQNMSNMFAQARVFDQPIGSWNVGDVANMSQAFFGAWDFNQDLDNWNTTNVDDMSGMFRQATSFNGQIASWDVSEVVDMSQMFWEATVFNQNIGEWTVLNVENMSQMFDDASAFNQDISNWNVATVSNFNSMFSSASSFDQSLANWDISAGADFTSMLDNTALSIHNYDETLIGWNSLTLPNAMTLGASGLHYCTAVTERQAITNTHSWTIDDAGQLCNPEVISILPSHNAIGITKTTTIDITFSVPMALFPVDLGTSSVMDDKIRVWGSHSGYKQGTWLGDGINTLTFEPAEEFYSGEKVFITVTSQVESSNGASLARYYNFEFTVATLPGPETPNFYSNNSEGIISDSSPNAREVYMADMDGDGDMDILSASFTDDKIAWYENDGQSTPQFIEHIVSTNADAAWSVTAADIDGDGDMDILSASQSDNKTAWYENDGAADPTFTEIVISTATPQARRVMTADMNGDGHLDVVVASYFNGELTWFENDGATDPSFTFHFVKQGPGGLRSTYPADMDNDGDTDLLAIYFFGGQVAWFENDGTSNPTFTEHVVSTSSPNGQQISAADVNGDGFMDILTASHGDNTISWFENDGAAGPSFTERIITTNATTARSVFGADVDGDGDMDLISGSGGSAVNWYENDGEVAPGFTTHNINPSTSSAFGVFAGDVDGDGDLDIISAMSDGLITWYQNTSPPEISVYDGESTAGQEMQTASNTVDFGNIEIGTDSTRSFTIENIGLEKELIIDSIVVDGTTWRVENTLDAITFGTANTFAVTFEGDAEGVFRDSVYIYSNDLNENKFTFEIIGSVFDPNNVPDIAVYVGVDNTGASIANGQINAIDFGNIPPGEDSTMVFSVENSGSQDLTITNISVVGNIYSVNTNLTTISSGSTETFTITFTGTNEGVFDDQVTIISNDPIDGTFIFDLTGAVSAPQLIDTLTGIAIPKETTVSWLPENPVQTTSYNLYSSTTKNFVPSAANLIANVVHPDTFYIDNPSVECDSVYYKVTAVNNQGVEGLASNEIALFVPVLPTADAGTDFVVCEDSTELFAAILEATETGIWTVLSGSGNFVDSSNPRTMVKGLSDGVNILQWKVEDIDCNTSDSGTVAIEKQTCIPVYEIIIYEGVSPNGDGKNDFLYIENIQYFESNVVSIVNRWGEPIIKIEDYNNENNYWDGTSRGNRLPEGVYYCVVTQGKKRLGSKAVLLKND